MREFALILSAIDGCVRRRVHHKVERRFDLPTHGIRVADVEFAMRNKRDLRTLRPRAAKQLAANLSTGSGYKNPHLATCISAIRLPSRPPSYRRARIRCHHSILSTYHRTVLRSPDWKLSCGDQPSSVRILVGSIA